ncbi:uncharacterized protein F4812DRAFT_200633 [Daldinia caldariorum]|uniref:uncharacterized protein n=1 Tax=Daldinia caldariorum TaxID=326644 RepID=UPI00200740A6|nr:uncharacterized protein F4812DRAFT_200633 [Daldinia caldariorum]KAI1471964.1 hypothetical protein F4812DRAFT_200633 [Daldinia caldariorum]
MAQAWLDSLSEDWVSQPRSDTSQAHVPSFMSPKSPNANTSRRSLNSPASRIPRFNAGNATGRKSQQSTHNSSAINILSERSINDSNIRGAQRGPPKPPQAAGASQRGRYLRRSTSASSAASVVHNTVQHNKSQSSSPSKNRDSVPEWRRRLVYGELNYGESKDLFSSAGTGLENIFRPPVAQESTGDESAGNEDDTAPESTLPSSPPPYSRQQTCDEEESFEQSADESLLRQPRPNRKQIKFRMTEEMVDEPSKEDVTFNEHHNDQEEGNELKVQYNNNSYNFLGDVGLSRQASGQSVMRNEDLSPILLSRHDSGDGQVNFAPVELPAEQLRKRLDNLRRNQMLLDFEPDGHWEQGPTYAGDDTQKIDTTEDFIKNGGFLNVQRGGRSTDGSFRQRPLSPPLNLDTSEMLPESSLQASTPKQFPTVRIERVASEERREESKFALSPGLPPAPYPSPERRSQQSSGQNGSPLKLFGPYDTFTNQTLLRRISQFEDQMIEPISRTMASQSNTPPTQEPSSKLNGSKGVATGSGSKGAPQASFDLPENLDISYFGAGELDGYEFTEDITQNSMDYSQLTNKENVAPADDSLPPSQFLKFQFPQDLSFGGRSLAVQRRRNKLFSSSFTPRRSITMARAATNLKPQSSSYPPGPLGSIQATPQRDILDGKRPRTSPSKDPTPKRRRTLHRSDIAYGLEDQYAGVGSVQSSHRTMQSIMGAQQVSSQSESQGSVSPPLLPMYQAYRPRSPTLGHGPSTSRERQPLATLTSNPEYEHGVSDISIQDFAVDGSARTSMKTQDFFDAAEQIMAMIRNKARPKNDLSSVEESEAEITEQHDVTAPVEDENSSQESTQEPFLRPPSREGPPLSRAPTHQEDPAVADRLKQYEEVSDLGEIITNSMHSMGRIRKAINEANSLTESIRQSFLAENGLDTSPDDQDIVSDLANVRISRNPDFPDFGEDTVEFPTNATRSSGASTARSIHSSSSHASDSKRLIAPDVVTPLIGNQVGNMVFDKERNVWYKVKQPRPSLDGRNVLPSEDSEDPFASIPDLSVDTIKETEHLGSTVKQDVEDDDQSLQEESSAMPSPAKSPTVPPDSVNDESMLSQTSEAFAGMKQPVVETAVEDDKEIEHEIRIHEDRMHRSSSSRQRRNLTISFSSPIASIIQDVAHLSDDDIAAQELGLLDESPEHLSTNMLKPGGRSRASKSVSNSAIGSRSRSRSARNLSVKGQEFVPRPVSRIDEQDEDANGEQAEGEERQISLREDESTIFPEGNRQGNTSVSVVVTPAPTKASHNSATPIIGQYVGTFSLSPLSDFTMHQADQSCGLEVSYVVGDRYLATGDGSKKIMSKAIQNLVEKITEVEPFEPDWETMRELDINGKQLKTLHMLDEFCTSVVTLDASNNAIEHLDGMPVSVRNLRIVHNRLSELTAWGHLMNLQYVDVSNNQISSLHAFRDLVHLRNLRADNNLITDLDGIKMHDSLQVLRARGNLLEEVNLDGTMLQRLTELDLENNQISSIQGVEQLTSLTSINLQHNKLSSFAPSANVAVPNLRYVTLSNNEITTLDLSPFTSLRLLHADRNRLTTVRGFSRCRRLDSLSLREQQGDAPLDASSFLNAAFEVRKLFLSGNFLSSSSFAPSVDFLNLQYLELANCGLRRLPPDLGQLMPNLRVLNLNMNALEDLTPLRFIPRLKKLLVAGNRLADPAQVADVLAGFPHLARLDLRDNPATLGFYAPIQALVATGEGGGKGGFDPFTLPDADPARDDKFSSRSDMGTRMRRRLYELVVLDRCRRLKMLDGLPVDAPAAGGSERSRKGRKGDKVWDALVRSGVVKIGDDDDGSGEGEGGGNDGDGRTKDGSVAALS